MHSTRIDGPIQLLMIDDNPDDIDLAREALKEAKVLVDFFTVEDGEAGLDFLYQRGDYVDVPHPDLILLDLNLPKVSGHEILTQIKSDDQLKVIPIVIMTTSETQEDIMQAYLQHANSYITKPIDLEQFIHVIQSFDDFWSTIVKLPTKV